DVLVHRHPDREGHRVWRIHAYDRQGTGLGDALYRPLQRLRGGIAGLPERFVFGRRALARRTATAMFGINANGVDDSIHTDTASQSLERFNGVLAIEIDGFSALMARHAQAVIILVDGENPSGSQQF